MTPAYVEHFLGNDKEFTIQYINQFLKNQQVDYFVYGHRHLALDIPIQNSRYINTGDWLTLNTYMVMEEEPILQTFSLPAK